jgi:hypothetical protein
MRYLVLIALVLMLALPVGAQADSPLTVEKFVGAEGAWFTADAAPGLSLPLGVAVTYRLVVSNSSETETLTNLTLTDSLYDITDCEIPAELGAGQSFECVVGPIDPESVGQTVNVALATAQSGTALFTATDSAVLTTTENADEVQIIVGVIEAIDGQTVIIDGVTYVVIGNEAVLALLKVGDEVVLIVTVAEDGTITVVLITLANEDIYIDDDPEDVDDGDDEDDGGFRDDAPCQANPPDWAPAYGWRMKCDPESLANFVLPPGQAKKLGRDTDETGELTGARAVGPNRDRADKPGRGNGRGNNGNNGQGNGNGRGNNGNGNGKGNGKGNGRP